MKKLLFFVVFLISVAIAFADVPNPGHSANQIGPGNMTGDIGIKPGTNSGESNLWFNSGSLSSRIVQCAASGTCDNVGDLWIQASTGKSIHLSARNGGNTNVLVLGNVSISTTGIGTAKLSVSSNSGTLAALNTNTAAGSSVGMIQFWRSNVAKISQFLGTDDGYGLQVNGMNSFYIKPNGYVGIGITNPGAQLDIKQSTNDYAGGLRLSAAGSTNTWNFYHNGASENLGIARNNAASPYLTIVATNGNVGIGVMNPTAKLEVAGRINATGDICTAVGNKCLSTVAAAATGFWNRTGNNLYPANLADKIGIGTKSPATALDVNGTLTLRPDSAPISKIQTNSPDALMKFETKRNSNSWKSFVFTSNNSDLFTILQSGNVGIGTTSPGALLHVKSPSGSLVTRFEGLSNSYNSKMYISSVSSGDGGFQYLGSNKMDIFSYGDMAFDVGTGNLAGTIANERMRITQTGNVGIGTLGPAYKLDVEGGDLGVGANQHVIARYTSDETYRADLGWNSLQLGNNGGNFIIAGRTLTGGALSFVVNNVNGYKYGANSPDGITAMTIASSGNVGIGTTSPQVRLHLGNVPDAEFMRIDQGNGYYHSLKSYMSGSNSYLSFNIANGIGSQVSNVLFLKGDGNVGIGTSSPGTSKLNVAGMIESSSGGYKFPDGTTQTTAATAGTSYWTASGTSAITPTGSNQIIFPAIEGGLQSAGSTGVSIYDNEINAKGSNGLHIQHPGTSGNGPTYIGNGALYVQNSGNVGIGTTIPGYMLEVAGNTCIGNKALCTGATNEMWSQPQNSGIVDFWINYRGYNNDIYQFRNLVVGNGKASAIAYFQGSTQRVGIGTTAPAEKLEVSGNVKISGGGTLTGVKITVDKSSCFKSPQEGWLYPGTNDYFTDGSTYNADCFRNAADTLDTNEYVAVGYRSGSGGDLIALCCKLQIVAAT